MKRIARGAQFVVAFAFALGMIAGVPSSVQSAAGATGLDAGAWPCFGQNIQMTRQSPYLGAQTSDLKWSVAMGWVVRATAAVGADGTVYVGSQTAQNTGVLHALSPTDGSEKWAHPLPAATWSSPAIASDGTIYVGCYDGNLYAINPVNGSEKWHAATDGLVGYQDPTIGSDGTVYLSVDTVSAFNPSDGSLKWRHAVTATTEHSPSFGTTGTVYVGAGSIYALDPATGAEEWTFWPGSAAYFSPAVGGDGTLYFGTGAGTVYALDPLTRTPVWTHSVGSPVFSSPAIASDGTVYVGCQDGSVHALSASDGSEKWSHATGASVGGSPSIGSDGTVYLSNRDGTVQALNAADGSVKWSAATAANLAGNLSPVSTSIGSDGTVYIGCDNGTFYAFGVPSALSPTSISLTSASASSLAYGSAFSIRGKLESGGVGLSSKQVILQSAVPGASFKDVSGSATTAHDGTFSFSVMPKTKTLYRARFAGSTAYAASGPTSAIYVLPRPYVGNPVAPWKMSRAKSYAVYGYLKPRHTAGTYPVRIYRYRYVSGQWKSYGYTKARAYNYSTYTKYAVSLKLVYTGKWRLRAYAPADAGHAATWSSGYDYVTVK